MELACNEVIFGGDINLDLFDILNQSISRYINTLDAINFQQIILSPTSVTKTSSTPLGHNVVTISEKNCICGTKNVLNISLHYLVYCKLGNTIRTKYYNRIRLRNFKDIDRDLLNYFLTVTSFVSLIFLQTVDEKVQYFNNALLNIFDTVASEKNIKMKSKKPGWLTVTIKIMIKLKYKAFVKAKTNK